MSKITEIKKQFPELNISILDLLLKIDGTKTNKYVQLYCNLLSRQFQPYKMWKDIDAVAEMKHITKKIESLGVNCEGMSPNEIYVTHLLLDHHFNHDDIRLLSSFRKYNERNLIPNRDVTSYKNLDEIRASVGLASLKENEKEMKSQIVKEFEDDTWLVLRPLTFGSSSKYGSATKWCTTYQNDKQYFERYWRRGILVYFINKITGLKFATFKSLDGERELSFWNAADNRVDFLELEIDDYMIPIIKNVLKSDKTNRDLCTEKIKQQVLRECNYSEAKFSEYANEVDMQEQPTEDVPQMNFEISERLVEPGIIQLRPLHREIRNEVENLRESIGFRLQNIEIGGTHQVGEMD
jgi:hypothetical protein